MTPELKYLVFVTLLTALLWLPYVLNRIGVRGLSDTVGYPADPKPLTPWALRMKAAHYNAVENLVVFATLVLVAHLAGVHNAVTLMACVVYFWARVVHALAYTLAVPWVRTLSFAVGLVCQLALAFQLLV